jgi:hypothetical protein
MITAGLDADLENMRTNCHAEYLNKVWNVDARRDNHYNTIGLMALKRAVYVRQKNVSELWPQMAGLAGSGWDLAGLAVRAAATSECGATEIFPVVAGWLLHFRLTSLTASSNCYGKWNSITAS